MTSIKQSAGIGRPATAGLSSKEKDLEMKKRILVVDDDWIFLQLLKFRLSRHGFEVVVAREEKEFWEKAFQTKPDLIMIDLLLKNKMGPDVYENLINFGLDPAIPVIFISAFVENEEVRHPQKGQKFALYNKSCDFEGLLWDIQHFIKQKEFLEAREIAE